MKIFGKNIIRLFKLSCIVFLDLESLSSQEQKAIDKQKNNKLMMETLSKKEVRNSDKNRKILKLSDVIGNVESNFPLLAVAMQDLMIARSEYTTAEGAFDSGIRTSSTSATGYYQNQRFDTIIEQPTPVNGTSFFAGYRMGRGDFAPYYGERATNRLGEVRAGARVPLLRDRAIDKNRAGIQQAEIGLRLADLSVVQQKIEIYRNAMLRYWDWIASVEKLNIINNIYNIAKDRQEQIEKRVKAGELPKIEAVENKRIVLQRKAQQVSAEQSMIAAANELSLYLMTPENKAYVPGVTEIPDDPFLQLEEDENKELNQKIMEALEKRPELQRIQAQKEQNRLEKELAKNLSKPGIDFVFAVSQDFGAGSQTLSRPELEASLVLNVPIRNKTQEGKIDGANAKNNKLDAQEVFLRERIGADIKNISSFLEMTKERVILSSREVELSKEIETAEWKRFQMGEGTLILVNIREQTTAEARIREIDSLSDHKKAYVNFKAATMDILPPVSR